jgi:hypothetical protein
MAIARITRQGLTWIAILVAILWGCIFTEHYLTSRAQMETYRALRQMRYLKFKRHIEPTAAPKAGPALRPPSSVGPAVG